MSAASADVVSDDEAATLFAPLQGAASVLIGVSGGPDSVALLGLLAGWARSRNCKIHIATVDHALRPESHDEAEAVGRLAATFGLPHQILLWQGEKPKTGLPQAARVARYSLLCDWAKHIGASHLLTAHTHDDQAETILYRLLRGSGPAGLAGMQTMRQRDGIWHFRPFLNISKQRLIATAQAKGWPFITDPSNSDEKYLRARLRRIWPVLEAEGLSAGRLTLLGQRLDKVEQALQMSVSAAWQTRLGEHDDILGFDTAMFAALAPAVQERLLLKAVQQLALAEPLRLDRLEALNLCLTDAIRTQTKTARTLAGCKFSYDGRRTLRIAKAPPRASRKDHPNSDVK